MASEGPDSSPSIAARLFDLPEYDWAFARFVKKAIDELMIRKSPLLSRIKAVPSSSIPISRNTMPSGEVVENRPIIMALPFPVDFGDAVAGVLATITANIDIAAEEGLKTLMPQIYDYMGRLCRAAGTATDAKGEKLSHELILRSFENVELNFDENGQPEMPTLFTSPAVMDAIKALPPPTEEETRAWNAMIDRKRKEFNDRRRRRQLS
ncbi:MAG: hypothetical protein AAB403_11890 [Planctomycetota bacterium]